MEYPSSKRRKTSPTTKVDIDASKASRLAAQHGSKNGSQSRASFMSPTKASLARFNPHLLPRAGSADPPRSSVVHRRESRKAQTEDPEPNGQENPDPDLGLRENGQVNGNGRIDGEPSSSVYDETPSKVPTHGTVGRASGVGEGRGPEVYTPTHKRSRKATADKDAADEDEPSLPSTPSQLGLEPPPEKPKGLLFQSPGRRRMRQSRAQQKDPVVRSSLPLDKGLAVPQEQLTATLGSRTPLLSRDRSTEGITNSLRSKAWTTRIGLARRMGLLQSELTRLSISLAKADTDKDSTKRQTRLKRQLAQDARAYARSHTPSDQEAEEHRRTITNPIRGNPPVLAKQQGVIARSVYLSPFFRRPSFSTIGLEHGGAILEPSINVLESKVYSEDRNAPFIRQKVEIYTGKAEVFSKMQFSMDPLSQSVSAMSTDHIKNWASQELTPWLAQESSQRTLQVISGVIRKYLDLAELRRLCWSQCQDTLPNVIPSEHVYEPALRLANKSLKLTLWWRLVVDDEEKVRSDLSAVSEVPAHWHRLDAQGDLDRLNEVFDRLVRQRGVSKAISIMSRILFPP